MYSTTAATMRLINWQLQTLLQLAVNSASILTDWQSYIHNQRVRSTGLVDLSQCRPAVIQETPDQYLGAREREFHRAGFGNILYEAARADGNVQQDFAPNASGCRQGLEYGIEHL